VNSDDVFQSLSASRHAASKPTFRDGQNDYNQKRVTDLERRRAGKAQVVGLHDDDGAFDRTFWAGVSPSARLEAVWDLALERELFQGRGGDQPRLQRSLCRVERRGR
jgi:hypothetical protein